MTSIQRRTGPHRRYTTMRWPRVLIGLIPATIVPSRAMGEQTVAYQTNTEEVRRDFERNLRRWQALTVERRQLLRERYDLFRKLPADEQERLRRLYRYFERLDPQAQAIFRENWLLLSKLNKEELDRVRDLYHRMKQMPPERRQRLARFYKVFKQRTADQQADLIKRLSTTTAPVDRLAVVRLWLERTRPTTQPVTRLSQPAMSAPNVEAGSL